MGTTALGGYLVAQKVETAVTAAVAGVVDSTLISIDVPGDATIVDVIVETTDMDTGATLTFDVGDSAGPAVPDDNRFISAFSGQAAGILHANVAGGLLDSSHTYSNSGDTTIDLTILAAAATGVAGTVSLEVIYYR